MKPIDTIHSIMNNVVIGRVQHTLPPGYPKITISIDLGDSLVGFYQPIRLAVKRSLDDIST